MLGCRSIRWISWSHEGLGILCMLATLLATMNVQAADPVAADNRYWAYRPVERPAVPDVQHPEQLSTPIDAFILSRLEARQLTLAPEATREELLRRAKFDLHGLPPTPAEREQFLGDTEPRAFERLVDRLLDSPLYGERWGRIWLDVVRFADTAGYNADPLRPLAYKYRDYVIRSFNRDTPYDRFVLEQLAGDELFPDHAEALIATGFIRLPPDESNASNVPLARQDQLNDLTTAVGAIFLGQSLGCAQCHDHKFDAISQLDFYRIQAFFSAIIPIEEFPVGTPTELTNYEERMARWLEAGAAPRQELQQMEVQAKQQVAQERRMRFPTEVLAALDTLPEQRTTLQRQYAFYAERQLEILNSAIEKSWTAEQKQRRAELQQIVKRWSSEKPKPPRTVSATGTIDGPQTPPTFLLAGGSYDKPLEEVQPGFLSAVSEQSTAEIVAPRAGVTGRRTALARWLTDPRNPLPARVMVNRLWQGHFSKGLVDNANDLGVQTPAPKHPELLDWLASEFVSQGWSLKAMHRLIMSSRVYRQATRPADTAAALALVAERDPGNQLFSHFERHRIDAESLRDALLSVSGLLNPRMEGPGVRPELPPQFKGRDWEVTTSVAERQRRSIYIQVKRNLPYPFLQAFDSPDTFESCARRQVTTTGPQALTLLNSDSVLRYAQAFAGRLLREQPSAPAHALVREAYLLAYAREPRPEEVAVATQFLELQAGAIAPRQQANEPLALPLPFPKFLDPAQGAALVDFCHALFNSNEFLYVD